MREKDAFFRHRIKRPASYASFAGGKPVVENQIDRMMCI